VRPLRNCRPGERFPLGVGRKVLDAQAFGGIDQAEVSPTDRHTLKLDAERAGVSLDH
jgi:hypothetical protein